MRLASFFLLVGISPGLLPQLRAEETSQDRASRERMVEKVIIGGGVTNQRVIDASRRTPRHEFVPLEQRGNSYREMSVPIGYQQTISPPYMVASMTERLNPQPEDRVLEIGTGSGYQAAILSGLVKEVYTIEIVEPLGERAKSTLERLGYQNVRVKIGDGYEGWPKFAPFDKIIVTCSPEKIPQPLVDQLREGGLLLIPLGERFTQTLYLFRKRGGKLHSEALEPTFFVPMTGRAEQLRHILPSADSVQLVNGDFQTTAEAGDWPAGWYYLRRVLVTDHPDGSNRRFLRFANDSSGQASQAVQAIGINGQLTGSLKVQVAIRGKLVVSGNELSQQAQLIVIYFNKNREFVGRQAIGPWQGSFDWHVESTTMDVPQQAAGAVVVVGLLGSTGELDVDHIQIEPLNRKS